MLVVGSSGDAEPGRIRLSSKTDRLVHSSPVPVAIAPRGYRTDHPVTRVTVGFRDDDASWSLLARVAEICHRASAHLRVATFVVAPPRRPVTARSSHTETQVIDLWKAQAANAQREAKTYLDSQGFDETSLEFAIAQGPDWGRAIRMLDWEDGDILAVGSSATHPVARVPRFERDQDHPVRARPSRRGPRRRDTRPGMTAAVLAEQLRRVLPSDSFEGREPRDVTGALTALTKLADDRRPGEPRVAVYTPTLTENGWTSYRTIVQICTDDSPFLVDSVTAAIADADLTVHLLLHPILSVSRDADGRLLRIATDDGLRESWMHIETDRIPTDEQRAALQARIGSVLADVRAAVDDWGAMRRTCLGIVADLRTSPPTTVAAEAVASTVEFLSWLADDHFTFLGYREYALDVVDGEDVLRPVPGSGLGILRDAPTRVAHLRPEARATARAPRLLTVTKANSRATVHRPVYLDYVGVRTFDDVGNVTGERRLIGLFTSTAYASSVLMLPVIAAKVSAVLEASGHARGSHSAKNLLQILEDYPRDELFQDSPEHLLDVTTQVSKLQERRGSQVFVRSDEFGRFVSALVYVPRDRYNTPVRLRIESLLTESYGAEFIEHTAKVGDSPLAQLHCMLRMPRGVDIPSVDVAELNAGLEAAIRTWDSGFVDALHRVHDEEVAAGLFARYGAAFPESYKDSTTPDEAVADVGRIERLDGSGGIAVHLYAGGDDPRPAVPQGREHRLPAAHRGAAHAHRARRPGDRRSPPGCEPHGRLDEAHLRLRPEPA